MSPSGPHWGLRGTAGSRGLWSGERGCAARGLRRDVVSGPVGEEGGHGSQRAGIVVHDIDMTPKRSPWCFKTEEFREHDPSTALQTQDRPGRITSATQTLPSVASHGVSSGLASCRLVPQDRVMTGVGWRERTVTCATVGDEVCHG